MLRNSIFLLIPILLLSNFSVISTDLEVGIKKGNWIEYNVSYSGSLNKSHEVNWARMEILEVQGTTISVSIYSKHPDESIENSNYTLNLETGYLIDNFIIPANLNKGESFFDEKFGEVIIKKEENKQYAGATRTIISSTIENNTYYWDKSTGVSVEGISQTAEYSIHTIATDTNMWNRSFQGVFDFSSILLVSSVFIIIFVAGILAVVRYLKSQRTIK